MTDTLPITPDEFARRMEAIAAGRGPEENHGDADDLLCDVLDSLGYDDGVAIFKAMAKWYS